MTYSAGKFWARAFIIFMVCRNVCLAQQDTSLRVIKHARPAPCDSPCDSPCGGPGWTRIVHLDMTDPTQQCPHGLQYYQSSTLRGCTKDVNSRCMSTFFPVADRSYSSVCGRVNAYQYGTTDAFLVSITSSYGRTIEEDYFGGVSLTHGAIGSRQHIWSFAAAISERTTDSYVDSHRFAQKCPCTDATLSWPYSTPSFVGNDYFCDTGNLGPGWSYTTLYSNNPMWGGEGCGTNSNCCQFNNPPWFCKPLPHATCDPIELRICGGNNENIIVYSAEIFIK